MGCLLYELRLLPGLVLQARSAEVQQQSLAGAPTPQGVYGDQPLLEEMTSFIDELVKNGGEVSKEEVVAFYSYHPEFERFTGYKSNWKTRTFCGGERALFSVLLR